MSLPFLSALTSTVRGAEALALRQGAGVRVRAPARLHLGFVDPAATLGRRFGSLGLVLDAQAGLSTCVELRRGAEDGATAADAAGAAELHRALAHLEALRPHALAAGVPLQPLHLHLAQVLPAHAGLGSGTQLALAVGRAFAQLHGLAWDSATLARHTGRGLRSGVGIAGFDLGGLLLDGGPGPGGQPAPVLARLALPAPWRVLLLLDPGLRGLSGDAERAALARLAPLPQAQAAAISHELVMRVLPGAADADFALFAAGLLQVQQRLGEHFAPAQVAGAYASPEVARAARWLGQHAGAAVGQSSWGPTAFAFFPSASAAEAALVAARAAGAVHARLQTRLVRGAEHGALMEPLA
jgi:beta-RFAP synthase